MTCAHRLHLTSEDAVFAGQEAWIMQEMINSWGPQAGSDVRGRRSDWVSLGEQLRLVQRLGIQEAEAVAASFGLHDFGAAGAAVAASRDLQEAVRVMNLFAPLLNLRHSVRLHDCGNEFAMTFHEPVDDRLGVCDALLWVDLAKMVRFLEDLTGATHDPPRSGSLRTNDILDPGIVIPPQTIRRWKKQIRIPKVLFARRLSPASRATSSAYQRECRKIMRQLGERMLCQSVRRMLLECTDDFPTIAQTAARLGMSIRTFRRRLACQCTSFLQILDQVRLELAVRYLQDRRLTTELIAQRLGYSESANFRAAFRRWTGSSPRYFSVRSTSAEAQSKCQSATSQRVEAPCP